MFFYILYSALKKKDKFPLEAVFMPLIFLCYIGVLLPWGVLNYHIGVVAPYVLGMFFPFYYYCNRKSRLIRLSVNCLILFFVFVALVFIIKPRILMMADIKKTVVFLKDFSSKQAGSRYFFPPPFVESAYSISVFTGLPVKYIDSGVLSANILGNDVGNFIIFDNQDPSIDLVDVKIDKEVYRNDNWRIYEIKKSKNPKIGFKVKFKEPLLRRLGYI